MHRTTSSARLMVVSRTPYRRRWALKGSSVASWIAAASDLLTPFADTVFFVKDVEGRYVAVNRTLAARTRRASKSVLGLTPWQYQLHQGFREPDLFRGGPMKIL
jgi:hypothetical protein